MRVVRGRRLAVLLALLLAPAAGTALASAPPASCTCPLPSDILVFGEGNPAFAITTTIYSCDVCVDHGATRRVAGNARVRFGPYNPAVTACTPLTDILLFHFDLELAPRPAPPAGEAYLVPAPGDTGIPTYVQANPDLSTACVSAFNLDYRIRDVALTGDEGARAFSLDTNLNAAILDLPDNVRSSLGDKMPLGPIRLTQALAIDEPLPPSLRLWPEGLPIRVLPAGGRLRQNSVQVNDGAAYSFVPPQRSNIPAGQVVTCALSPAASNGCTGSGTVFNGGLFDSPAWVPSGVGIDLLGMDVLLELPSGQPMSYVPAFPQGTWASLIGPAHVMIEESRITLGSFDGGGLAAVVPLYPDCPYPVLQQQMNFGLAVNPASPQLGQDGSLLAGVTDLNDSGFIQWSYNFADALGCGTFYVPPVLSDLGPAAKRRGPQVDWLAPQGPTVLGRGLYAGINYNRDRVCTNGVQYGGFCRANGDCAGGMTCQELWSPFCQNPPSPAPGWATYVQGNLTIASIDPTSTTPADREREMAFYMRGSGVTGVFDAGGDPPISMGDPGANDFHLAFTSFGTAFLGSNSEKVDTIMDGTVQVPWPTDTNLPFNGLSICECGAAKSAKTPDGILVENELRYWDETFSPYSLDFMPDLNADCDVISQSCDPPGQPKATKVCVQALTPVPHFAPDFVSSFGLRPAGQPETLTPLAPTELEFEPNTVAGPTPWTFDPEGFAFSNWDAEVGGPLDGTGPDRCAVLRGLEPACTLPYPPQKPFGYWDAMGQIPLPYFGTRDAAVQVRRASPAIPATYGIDLHARHGTEQPDPQNPGAPIINGEHNLSAKHITVERKLAGDHLAVRYAVDYFQPSATADPGDGTDENGRGLMLGFTRDAPVALGATEVASGAVMDPASIHGDVGTTSAVRLWGLTTGAGRGQLAEVFPAGGAHLSPDNQGRYQKALAKLGMTPAALTSAADLTDAMHATGAAAEMTGHPDFSSTIHTSPPISADTITGFVDFGAGPPDQVQKLLVDSSLSTTEPFFSLTRSRLSVERHVEGSQLQAMSTFTRADVPGAMDLIGKQTIAFPGADALKWKFDYDVSPTFKFNSLSGRLDLTQGGFSGVAFDKMSATLKYYSDGDWYFSADMAVSFNGYGVDGTTLFGNTKDMTPLKEIDPDVAKFLKGIDAFKGAYIRCGAKSPLVNYGCALRVDIGAQIGGWYLDDAYGGQVSGWLSGKGACLVSVKGKAKLLGGEVGDLFKMEGSFWVAGGIGACDEGDWDSPGDAFDDDWCYACVVKTKVTGQYPPDDLDLSFSKPKTDCD